MKLSKLSWAFVGIMIGITYGWSLNIPSTGVLIINSSMLILIIFDTLMEKSR